MSGYREDGSVTDECRLLMEQYQQKFGELPPLFIMENPIEQMQHAMLVGKPYNPMPGDPGIPSDAFF